MNTHPISSAPEIDYPLPPDGEPLLSITEARARFATHPSIATVTRWILRGCSGHKLRSWRYGGRRVTTPSAIREFIIHLSAPADKPVADPGFAARAAADVAELDQLLGAKA